MYKSNSTKRISLLYTIFIFIIILSFFSFAEECHFNQDSYPVCDDNCDNYTQNTQIHDFIISGSNSPFYGKCAVGTEDNCICRCTQEGIKCISAGALVTLNTTNEKSTLKSIAKTLTENPDADVTSKVCSLAFGTTNTFHITSCNYAEEIYVYSFNVSNEDGNRTYKIHCIKNCTSISSDNDICSPNKLEYLCCDDKDGDGYGVGDNRVSCYHKELDCVDSGYGNGIDGPVPAIDIFPGQSEYCNGVDDNCNNEIDEDSKVTYYRDFDEDTYGNSNDNKTVCRPSDGFPPDGYVERAGDCDDNEKRTHPGAKELCGLGDNDCDGDPHDEDFCLSSGEYSPSYSNRLVVNSSSNYYNVSFTNNNYTTSESTDKIDINVLKWEYLLNGNEFQYCGNESPIIVVQNSNFKLREIHYQQNGDECFVTNNYYCSPNVGWSDYMGDVQPKDKENAIGRGVEEGGDVALISERTKLSFIPNGFKEKRPSECCPEKYCWSGDTCIEDQSNEPWAGPSFVMDDEENTGYRCIKGEWKLSHKKYSPSGLDFGYCEEKTMCFTSNNGDYNDNDLSGNNPQCVDSGLYFGDFLCDKGEWSSRTKALASSLSKNGGNKYSIYCDSYHNVLNYAKDVLGKPLDDFFSNNEDNICAINIASLSQPINCVNNFCIMLDSNNKISIGTTLNQNLDEGYKSMSVLFNKFGFKNDIMLNSRISKINDSKNNGKLNYINGNAGYYYYYEPSNKIFVISEKKLHNSFFETITKFFTNIFSWIKGEDSNSDVLFEIDGINSSNDLNFANTNKAYNKIFIHNEGKNKRIVSYLGEQIDNRGLAVDFIAAQYKGFSSDVCKEYFNSYDNKINSGRTDISCFEKNRNDYYVFIYDDKWIWQDISSKLRVR